MKSLLLAIQAALQTSSILSYVRDADIYITPHEDLMPEEIKFPAIGLKDGPIQIIQSEEFGVATREQETLGVEVILFVEANAILEITVIGQAAPAIKGILDLAADVHTVLEGNRLALTGVIQAFPQEEFASEWMVRADGEKEMQKKKLVYAYRKAYTSY